MCCAKWLRPVLVVMLVSTVAIGDSTLAATRTWIGGNNNWDILAANWTPADEPDSNDDAVFNTSNFVTMTINQLVEGVTLSGGASLSTGTQFLNVNGTIDLDGLSTSVTVHTNSLLGGTPPSVSIDADDIIITGGAEWFMANDVTVFDSSTTGGSDADTVGVVTVGTGSTFNGNGRLLLNNSVSTSTVLFQNNGTINALTYGNPGFITSGTLTLDAPDPESRIDLDGTTGAGSVNVLRSQTLDMNIRQSDDFDGTINIFANAELDFQHAWELNGTMNVNSGFIAGNPPFEPDQSAGIAVVAGGTVTMSESDSRINVVHNDGTLQFDAPLMANDGVIDNNGHLIFNANATIGSGVDFFMEFDADLTVNATVTVNDADWNWDDNGGSNNDLTINDNGTLNANITAAGASTWTGDMHIVGGTLNVEGDNNNWEQTSGNITIEGTSLGVIGGDQFSLTGGTFRVLPGANGDISAITFWDGGTLDVDGELELLGGVDWAGTTVTGDGVLEQEGNAVVSANTTITVDTYDWDQSTTLVLPGVNFTVDVDSIDRNDDTFNGNSITVNGSTLKVTVADGSWTLGPAGRLNMDSPLVAIPVLASGGSELVVASGGIIDVSAPVARIEVPLVLQEGSQVRLDGTLPTLRTTAGIELAGGDIVGISPDSSFVVDGGGLLVTGESSITADSLSWGVGGGTTIEPSGSLDVNVDDFGADTIYDGLPITMNSGDLDVNVTGAWQMDATLRINNTDSDIPVLSGDPVVFSGNIDVGGTGRSSISASASFIGTPTVDVEAGTHLSFSGNLLLLGEAIFTGEGIIAWDADTTSVVLPLTINMPDGTVDLDGDLLGDDTLSIQAPLTLNVGAIDVGINTFDDDTIEIDPNGSLTIDLPGSTEWAMSGVLNLNGKTGVDNFAIQLAGERVELRGTVNVTDQSQLDANLDITGEINIAAGGNLRVNGSPDGNQFVSPIRLEGGVINGPGRLSISNSRSLVGFGTVNADIDFDGPNPGVYADNGELVVNGAILDLGGIGTEDDDGILNVTNVWTTTSAGGVELNGGEVRGAKLTVDGSSSLDGISGHGLITPQVVNEGTIRASGGTLTIQHRTINDYDGLSDSGRLSAGGSDLVIDNDTGAGNIYTFRGTLIANGNALILEDLSHRFAPESTLNLTGGTFRSTERTRFGGTINSSGVSTIERNGITSTFSEFEATSTINITDGELQLLFLHGVFAGAEFTGAGKLTNMSTLDLYDGADVGVHVENHGALRLLDFTNFVSDPSHASVASLEQFSSGRLFVDIAGTDFDDYSRLQVGGTATLDGGINIFLDDDFEPALGDTFTVLTAGQVVGTFSAIGDFFAELGPGLGWDLIYNPTGVQLTVVANLTADADLDGDVDGADFLILQRTNPALIPDWQAQYGLEADPLLAESSAVPEPGCLILALWSLCYLARRQNSVAAS